MSSGTSQVPGPPRLSRRVAMIYLPKGHHVLQLLIRYLGQDEGVITKTVDVVP